MTKGHIAAAMHELEDWKQGQWERIASGQDIRFGLEDGNLRGLSSFSLDQVDKMLIQEID